ncbi:Rad52/Rad22 family DNA repair protein [Streptomyces europaeiscabiei]|uniref:Rad52/Rad22 family DNA repair protein n=1 Tax=Streptomyces europaeiscabiei TaxID=146819 RepID=A0ABU4P1W6_9ACTN|nr:Rad52/Rad22 family DNA repair protein [Streptomyces europaeiscabiei]MDX2763367.1 Rad52/Rad22 family DNA repair protein [Streptomyces europaeiscabiei]MDX3544366.1 Rad52/Rad22 family DNA repair protein [Streptomyces europaeiscabiei]MDX3558839.1 Rad52/Rad22 family DNA repair protein [Streptomyces europaeiscabiei]MDX3707225.1 Rad52/Rad22 family DNA repair protein [Streptomyces europaeiscabiei]
MSDITSRLTDNQLKVLFAGLHNSRVGHNQKGFAHVQQWDVRRFLIRVFGFGGYDTELVSIDCVREIEHPPSNPSGKSRWTVVYRVHQRLTIKDIAGNPIASYDGVATGDAQNQPGLGDAHDGAVKEADSQSLKRAAVNLGDAFGLSLYNGGKTDAVVKWSAAHPEPASDAPSVPEDPPVLPDPEVPQPEAEEPQQPSPPPPAAVPDPPQQQRPGAMPAAGPNERQTALDAMWAAAQASDFVDGLPAQFESAFGHAIEQGTAAEFRQATDLMRGSVAA